MRFEYGLLLLLIVAALATFIGTMVGPAHPDTEKNRKGRETARIVSGVALGLLLLLGGYLWYQQQQQAAALLAPGE